MTDAWRKQEAPWAQSISMQFLDSLRCISRWWLWREASLEGAAESHLFAESVTHPSTSTHWRWWWGRVCPSLSTLSPGSLLSQLHYVLCDLLLKHTSTLAVPLVDRQTCEMPGWHLSLSLSTWCAMITTEGREAPQKSIRGSIWGIVCDLKSVWTLDCQVGGSQPGNNNIIIIL